ncbi:MAG: hypothetical protein NWE99_07615, partial [Candidatus Bathyarchaeota archaeon]|nr:hypothetical protein [Candidatus Bathyarchaeota archaeon]
NIVIRPHLIPDDKNSLPVILPRNSIYAMLFSDERNDASRLEYTDNNVFALAHNINGRIVQINSENPVFETQSLSRPLPPQLQQMPSSFEERQAP